MTDYIPQTGASKRYEAARKIIAAHDAAVDAYADATDMDEAYAAEARMEDATSDAVGILRALITPPSVGETEEQIVNRIMSEHGYHDPRTNSPESSLARDVARAAVRAGIQAAHETWEPADVPSQEQMLRWLGIKAGKTVNGDDAYFIPAQYIEREAI